jgi:D-3-phosphoglycerate dehydrogenase / 2-oxoglutarate reductase
VKILIASPLDPSTVVALENDYDVRQAVNADPDRLGEAVADRDAVILRSGVQLSADVLSKGTDLRLIVRAGSGLDNIDVDFARKQGIRVVRIPGMSGQPVAEFTFALLLSLARKVTLADRLLREGHWPKAKLGGPLLSGKTLGIVGAGNIGSLVGEMGAAWGMRAIGCVGNPNADVGAALKRRGIELLDVDEVVAQADFLCLHVPLDDRTRHMIDAGVLKSMRPGSLLINVARGGVVDEEALYESLVRGDIVSGAALDVHEQEGEGTLSRFADLPNVVLTPHIGAMALDSQRLIGNRALELITAFRQGRLDQEVSDDERVA